ncbi:MAG: hypothetical protein IK152_02210 [Lachnospiraceae bacterium]|nr:hypothetical protein [Lachnospiraceae bacterium]
MDTDFDLKDDFFDDDTDFSSEPGEDAETAEGMSANEKSQLDQMMAELTAQNPVGTEIMLLYDAGSLKDNLRRCLSQTDYSIVEAEDLSSAREALKDHPKLSITVANSTVGGDDAASILRSLVTINPDLICIICTDMIDILSFSALINTAPVYKILTFPLDIDEELIPALDEMVSVSMVRSVNREEWNSLVRTNEDLARQLRDALHFSRIRQGTMRRMYNGMVEVLAQFTTLRCVDPFGNTINTIKVFQKKIVDRFFLSLSSNDISMEQHIKNITDVFGNEAEGRIVNISCDDDPESNLMLRSRLALIIWILFYRLSLTGRTYSGNAEITFKGRVMAFLDVTYDLPKDKWIDLNNNSLQKSYTGTVEGISDSLVSAFSIIEAPERRVYKMTVSTEPDE